MACAAGLLLAVPAAAQDPPSGPLDSARDRPIALLDVPFITQSEALCGGAAAAMVLRYWGERGVTAESFTHLLDKSAAGIRTTALVADLQGRGWQATAIDGREDRVRGELSRGRPVLVLVEDRPGTLHYVVIVAWHERGVVFHDPARAPFRVMAQAEFDRRWRASDRWMAVVLPPAERSLDAPDASSRLKPAPTIGETPCDALIADGVRLAQANNLDAAERTLTSALGCPGGAAPRELAGVRLLQRRWPEVSDLASAAITADPGDTYAWKLLGTARYVENDRAGALEAWNHAGEPRLDLIRVDGLRRTRQRVVEQLLGVHGGELLTSRSFLRARRRLAELPSAASTRLDYVPVPTGLAELRGAIVERPLLPSSRLSLAALALSAAARRELRVASASATGGGEEIAIAWRFWPHRPRAAVDVRAPAPWGGVWGVEAFMERQPFTGGEIPRAERTGALLHVADWTTSTVRVGLGAGVDRWNSIGARGRIAGDARWLSADDRLDARAGAGAWLGGGAFGQLQASFRVRSTTELQGYVGTMTSTFRLASNATPLDLWFAGDTGHAQDALLRAHPVLDDGYLRLERLGRALVNVSLEGQHWWRARGVLRAGAAAFADAGRTLRILDASATADADVGIGARFAVIGMPGIFRVDLAKGLRDGATALSFVYQP